MNKDAEINSVFSREIASSSNEKRLAALGSRGRGPPQSGGRAWSFRLLDFHCVIYAVGS